MGEHSLVKTDLVSQESKILVFNLVLKGKKKHSTDKEPYIPAAFKGITPKETHFVCAYRIFSHTGTTAIHLTLSLSHLPVLKR